MQMQSNVYEASTTYTLVLFLNTAARHDNYYGVHPGLQELSICVAASLTEWAINQKYAVGLYANGSMYRPDESHNSLAHETTLDESERLEATIEALRKKRRIRVPASNSATQRQRIMEVLARIQPFFGTSIEEVLQTERSHLPSGATVVVITTAISDRLVDMLARVRQEGHAVSILFIGDSPFPIKIAGVTVYSIGGEDTWNRFLTASSTAMEREVASTSELHL
jgi:hypothetical protein